MNIRIKCMPPDPADLAFHYVDVSLGRCEANATMRSRKSGALLLVPLLEEDSCVSMDSSSSSNCSVGLFDLCGTSNSNGEWVRMKPAGSVSSGRFDHMRTAPSWPPVANMKGSPDA
jgi:hypothetical protein